MQGAKTRALANASMQGMKGGKKATKKGEMRIRQMRVTTRMAYGEIDSGGFTMPRHAAFYEKGAGRGYKIVGGVPVKIQEFNDGVADGSISAVYRGSKIRKYKARANASFYQGRRRPHPFFNPAIDAVMPELADVVQEYSADKIINATKIRIR